MVSGRREEERIPAVKESSDILVLDVDPSLGDPGSYLGLGTVTLVKERVKNSCIILALRQKECLGWRDLGQGFEGEGGDGGPLFGWSLSELSS